MTQRFHFRENPRTGSHTLAWIRIIGSVFRKPDFWASKPSFLVQEVRVRAQDFAFPASFHVVLSCCAWDPTLRTTTTGTAALPPKEMWEFTTTKV